MKKIITDASLFGPFEGNFASSNCYSPREYPRLNRVRDCRNCDILKLWWIVEDTIHFIATKRVEFLLELRDKRDSTSIDAVQRDAIF